MKKYRIFLFFILLTIAAHAGEHAIVSYRYFFNGNEMTDMPKLLLVYSGGIAKIESSADESTKKAHEEQYLNYTERMAYQSLLFRDGSRVTAITPFDDYPKPELTDEYAEILGFKCRKARVIIRSNNIDIWFIEGTELKGTPLLNQGTELGLVLKIVRNGNFEITAENIDTSYALTIHPVADFGEIVDIAAYREKVTELNYTTVQIFTDETINFDESIIPIKENESNITCRFSKGTVILKKVSLPENMWGHTIIAELSTYSAGDAYDRTGSLFIIPSSAKTSFLDALKNGIENLPEYKGKNGKSYRGIISNNDYLPLIELMRFITPFGIKKYNEQVTVKAIKWEDSVIYKQDITDIASELQGEVWMGVFIGNYDKGGHIVSLKLKYYPNDLNAKEIKQKKFWVQPVINTVNVMETSGQEYGTIFEKDTITVMADIPEGLKSLKLRYISTGHGGWDGGDEFNQKLNEIIIDGTRFFSYIPWRTDCGMYRKFNPSSGNFPNGMSSSDFSRSGWCPGSISIPVDIPLTGLVPGRHTFGVYIPLGKPEGNSFSSWNVSAVLIGEY